MSMPDEPLRSLPFTPPVGVLPDVDDSLLGSPAPPQRIVPYSPARRSPASRMMGNDGTYDEVIASFLCAVSAWSYSDQDTFGQLLSRMGFPESDCVKVTFENDPLLVNSTALFVQTTDRRLAIVCFQGTKPLDAVTWLGNISARADPFGSTGKVHGGFNRTVLALLPEMRELFDAIHKRTSIVDAEKAFRERVRVEPKRGPFDTLRRYERLKGGKEDADLSMVIPTQLLGSIEEGAKKILESQLNPGHSEELTQLIQAQVKCLLEGGGKMRWTGMFHGAIPLGGAFIKDVKGKSSDDLKILIQHELDKILESEVTKALDDALSVPERPIELCEELGREPPLKLYITGHSLGGALAVLAAAHLYFDTEDPTFPHLANEHLRGVYTFGQPMVGDELFTDRCGDAFGSKLFRHVYHDDLVPRVPPRSAGKFAHAGTEYGAGADGWAARTGAVSQTSSILWSLWWAAVSYVIDQLPVVNDLTEKIPPLGWLVSWLPVHYSVGDHSPLNYLRTSNATRSGSEFG